MNTTRINDRVYILSDSAGCCSNLVIGQDRALVFDTCCGIDDLLAAVRAITPLPLLVINSHAHFDHVGGNAQFEKVYLHPLDLPILKLREPELLEKWRCEMAGREDGFPTKAGDFGNIEPLDFTSFDLGGLRCEIVPLKGHTLGSVGVYIPQMRLLLSGDALTPVMMLVFAGHGTAEDEEDTLRRVMALDLDIYLTSHHEKAFPKELLGRILRCLQNRENENGYNYRYPTPPYEEGRLFLDRAPGEPVAVVL